MRLAIAAAGRCSTQLTTEFLNFGRVVSIDRLTSQFGYTPVYSTSEAFDSYLTSRPVPPVLSPGLVAAGESAIAGALGVRPRPLTTQRTVRNG